MPVRRYFRVWWRRRPLCFEGWMPQQRGCHKRRRSLWVSAGRVAGVAVLMTAGALIAGAPASAQTLTESFAYAYNNNPQLLAQRAALRAADEGVPQALANWRPTVNFTGAAGFTRGASEQPDPATGAPTPSQFASFVNKSL